jgi:hypothetical protein
LQKEAQNRLLLILAGEVVYNNNLNDAQLVSLIQDGVQDGRSNNLKDSNTRMFGSL